MQSVSQTLLTKLPESISMSTISVSDIHKVLYLVKNNVDITAQFVEALTSNPNVAGVMLKYRSLYIDVDCKLPNGRSALNYAIETGLFKIARELIYRGSSVNLVDPYKGVTPLIEVAGSARVNGDRTVELGELLVQYGADVNAVDVKGMTAMHHLATNRCKWRSLEELMKSEENWELEMDRVENELDGLFRKGYSEEYISERMDWIEMETERHRSVLKQIKELEEELNRDPDVQATKAVNAARMGLAKVLLAKGACPCADFCVGMGSPLTMACREEVRDMEFVRLCGKVKKIR
jgi:hypothetical protein